MLGIEIFLCLLGSVTVFAKLLAQLPITRIARNQVGGIGLKKILQGELPLFVG